jgi:hypothetical protein
MQAGLVGEIWSSTFYFLLDADRDEKDAYYLQEMRLL